MTSAPGRTLAHHRLEWVIGAGAFATVYEACDDRPSDTIACPDTVAPKLLPDGTVLPDATQVQLRTYTTGIASAVLAGVSGAGEHLQVQHDLRVVG